MSLLAGVLCGLALPFPSLDTGVRAHNIKGLVFYVILPVLIFGAAWHLKPALLRKWMLPIVLMATLGVLISFVVIAGGAYYGIGHPVGFPWIAALLLGAILAATDPVAIVAALERFTAPVDLTTIVEGESLLNDATAVVLFSAVFSIALSMSDTAESLNYLQIFNEFLIAAFSGLLIGSALAIVTVALILYVGGISVATVLLLLLAFGSFYVAEHFFHFSGIFSVMAAAITAKTLLDQYCRDEVLELKVEGTWAWLALFFISLVFVLMGLVLKFTMFVDQWLAIIIAIAAMLVSRAIVVFGAGGITQFTCHKVPFGWQLIMAWGSLRGAVAVVLVLSLPTSLPYWWTVQPMVFGAVLFTLVVQGLTSGGLIQRYRDIENWMSLSDQDSVTIRR
ncbi:MAG: CPA1 family monovalent cation:H+ antiporter [Candidatus Azotimanducaceae bacterium]|jgi:CPA1 family monovalent cation:H+ antiporter